MSKVPKVVGRIITDHRQFAKELEKRTRKFALQITEKSIGPEARQITKIRSKYVKVNLVKHNIHGLVKSPISPPLVGGD